MFYIEAKEGNHTWISGIFMVENDARKYFDSISEKDRAHQQLKSAETSKYPIYLVEDKTFYFADLPDIHQAIKNIKSISDPDAIYLNIYKIEKDFKPRKPGSDYMGSLYHIHITNSFLEIYQEYENPPDPFNLP